ncbi:MAG: hypothetical protein K8W52_37060 [Deltaproteobacteria bacterium]|nr:hypothetical protein [Deltaproteobacteria bacterium]
MRQAAVDDAALLGFSGADVIGALNARGPAQFTWQTGETTTVTVHATAVAASASVDAPPPYQGHCQPSVSVEAQLHVFSADGRLDATIPTTLVGLGPDRELEVVFPADARFEFARPTPLPIPEAWSDPSRPTEAVAFSFHADSPGALSPYCLPGEPVSDDPALSCNRYSGLVRFVAYDPAAPIEGPSTIVNNPVGWWTWP